MILNNGSNCLFIHSTTHIFTRIKVFDMRIVSGWDAGSRRLNTFPLNETVVKIIMNDC